MSLTENAGLVNGVTENITIPNPNANIRFNLPKLNSNSGSLGNSVSSNLGGSLNGSSGSLTPHELSLKKIMDIRKLRINDETDVSNPIDSNLSASVANATVSHIPNAESLPSSVTKASNLLSENFVVDLRSALVTEHDEIIVPTKVLPEQFDIKFVDCDAKPSKFSLPILAQNCEIDISDVLNKTLVNRTKHTTAFGKILCSRFRCQGQPYIKHGFNPNHVVIPFKFDTLNHLARAGTAKKQN